MNQSTATYACGDPDCDLVGPHARWDLNTEPATMLCRTTIPPLNTQAARALYALILSTLERHPELIDTDTEAR